MALTETETGARSAQRTRPYLTRENLGSLIYLAGLVALFALTRPYRGVVGDSILYVGKALSILDPDGVGRDPMWVLDGQMRFSLFPSLLAHAVSIFGAEQGVLLVALVGVIVWAIGLIVLSRAIGAGRMLGLIVACCAFFPAGYSAYASIYFAEPIATPRIFAEAFVLCSLAALVLSRFWLFAALSAGAVLIHPIMGLSGLATAFVYLCVGDRRWIVLGIIVTAALCLGGAIGMPLLDRLTTRIDPQWLDFLRGPTDSLFPTLWPEAAWESKTTQAVLVGIGIANSSGGARRLFMAILVASVAALLISILLGDLFPLLLVVQMQTWRATWLLAVGAAVAFPLSAESLWRKGATQRLCLALIVAALALDGAFAGAAVAVFAFVLTLSGVNLEQRFPARSIHLLCTGVALLVAVKLLTDLVAASSYASTGSQAPFMLLMLDAHAFAAPVALVVVGLCAVRDAAFRWVNGAAARMLAGVALCALAILFWREEWDPYRSAIAHAGVQEDLLRLIGARSGPVLWIGGNQEAWYWARRPNWASGIQGNGIVFSRELTLVWFQRMGLLRDMGWIADGGVVSRRLSRPDPVFPDLSPEKLQHFCALPEAPAYIIAPTRLDSASRGAALWRAPVSRLVPDSSGGAPTVVDQYLVSPCG